MEQIRYIDPNYKGPTLIRGYLKKLKSDMALLSFIKKFTKRYFILDLNNYFFGYQQNESSSKLQQFSLKLLKKVEKFPKITETCNYKFAFFLEIDNRDFFLYVDSLSAHNEWCNGLLACLPPDEASSKSTEDKSTIPLFASFVEGQGLQNSDVVNQHEKSDLGFSIQEIKSQPDSDMLAKPQKPEAQTIPQKTPEPPKGKPKTPSTRPHFMKIIQKEESEPVKEKETFPAVVKDAENHEDEDEVKVIAQPKIINKYQDSFAEIIPVVKNRGKVHRPNEPNNSLNAKKPDVCRSNEEIGMFKSGSALKELIGAKSSNIQGILDDLNEIGLEKVEIRTGSELRKNFSLKSKNDSAKDSRTNHKDEKNTDIREDSIKEAKPAQIKNFNEFENKEENITENKRFSRFGDRNDNKTESKKSMYMKTADCFKTPENKNQKSLKKLTIRPLSSRPAFKHKYVEKPDNEPDKGQLRKKKSEKIISTARGTTPKMSSVYKEKVQQPKPQGNDCDWETWDD